MKNLNLLLFGLLFSVSSIAFAGDTIPPFTPRKPVWHFKPREIDYTHYFLFMKTQNPAFAGIQRYHFFGLTDARYIDQKNFPLTVFTGFDMQLGKGPHSLGYWGGYSRSGSRWSMQHIINYAGEIRINRKARIRIGLGVGYDYTEYYVKDLTFGDMIDDRYGFVYTSQEIFTGSLSKPNLILNGGVMAYFYRTYISFSVNSTLSFSRGIISPNKDVSVYPVYRGSAFYQILLSRNWSLLPLFEFSVTRKDLYDLEGGVYVNSTRKNGMLAGISYTSNHIFSVTFNYVYNKTIGLGGKVYFPFSDLNGSYPVAGFMVNAHILLSAARKEVNKTVTF